MFQVLTLVVLALVHLRVWLYETSFREWRQDAIFSKTSTAMALRSGKILPTLEAGGSFEFSGDPQETTNRNIKEPQIFTMHTGDARQEVPSVDLCMRNW